MNKNKRTFNCVKMVTMMMLAFVFSIFCGLSVNEMAKAVDYGDSITIDYKEGTFDTWSQSKKIGFVVPSEISNPTGRWFGDEKSKGWESLDKTLDNARVAYDEGSDENALVIVTKEDGSKEAHLDILSNGRYTFIILDQESENYAWLTVSISYIDTEAPELENDNIIKDTQFDKFTISIPRKSDESPIKEITLSKVGSEDKEVVYSYTGGSQEGPVKYEVTKSFLEGKQFGNNIELVVVDVAGNSSKWTIPVDIDAPVVKAGAVDADDKDFFYQKDGKLMFKVVDENEILPTVSSVDVYYENLFDDDGNKISATKALEKLDRDFANGTRRFSLMLSQMDYGNEVYSMSLTKGQYYRFSIRVVDEFGNAKV